MKSKGLRITCIIFVVSLLVFIIAETIKPSFEIFKNPTYSGAIVGVVFVVGLLLGYLLHPRQAFDDERVEKRRNKRNDWKRYSIVFVDDMFAKQKPQVIYKHRLSNYDVFLMESADNVKQLIGFDIIVLDIIGVTSSLADGVVLIEELRKTYPQKCVIAVSSSKETVADLARNKKVDYYLMKSKNTTSEVVNIELADQLSALFPRIFADMDYPSKYWSMIERKIHDDPEDKKDLVKRSFEYSILANPSYAE